MGGPFLAFYDRLRVRRGWGDTHRDRERRIEIDSDPRSGMDKGGQLGFNIAAAR